MGQLRRGSWLTASFAGGVAALLVAGCATVQEPDTAPFTQRPGFGAGSPDTPEQQPAPPLPSSKAAAPCVDPDPQVVATCLSDPSAVVGTNSRFHNWVAERATGNISVAITDANPDPFGHIDVDASNGGGLFSFALSPYFDTDRLGYAYISTPTENQVVRIAENDPPKVILGGIPKNAGGELLFVGDSLFLVTASANTGQANDRNNLGGKVIKVITLRSNTDVPPQVIAAGFGARPGICQAVAGGVWVTDRNPGRDRLQSLDLESGSLQEIWTWSDGPGLSDCIDTGVAVVVSEYTAAKAELLQIDGQTGAVSGEPILLSDQYGRLGALGLSPYGEPIAATRNKIGEDGQSADPTATDDRLVLLPNPAGLISEQGDD